MSDPLDLSKLTDAQLVALKAVNGDLTKLPDAMIDSIGMTLHIKGIQDRGTAAKRIVGQAAIGVNDALANTAGAPVDALNWALKNGPGAETARAVVGERPGPEPEPTGGSTMFKSGVDYLATLPGRATDAVKFGSLSPFTDDRTSRFAPESRGEVIARDVGEGVGSVASAILPGGAVAARARPGMARDVANTVRQSPVTQTVAGATGGAVTGMTDDPNLGLAASLMVPFGAHGVQRTVSAAPARSGAEAERRALLQDARTEGIPLSAGKILDSKKLQTFESWLDNTPIPLLGGRQTALNEAQGAAFNRATLKRAGIDGDAATPNTIQAGYNKLSNRFNTLAGSSTINVDNQFGSALNVIEAEYGQQLTASMKPGLVKRLEELKTAATAQGQRGVQGVTIDGRAYQNIRSDLVTMVRDSEGNTRRAAGQLIEALDDMAGRSLPKDVMSDWKEVRRLWRNLSTIDDAMGARHNQNVAVGNVPPASLHARADGNRDLERLSQVGAAFVGDKIPNSGTGPRTMLNALALGGGGGMATGVVSPTQAMMAAGATAVPYGFDLAMNNPMMRALLMRRYANPSQGIANSGLVATLAGENAVQRAQGGR